MVTQRSLQALLDEIDYSTSPDKMKLDDAVEFLEKLAAEIGVRIDAFKDDLQAVELRHERRH